MFDDLSSLASVLLRFAHIAFGILWLGVIYFFALINGPFQKAIDDATKAKINPQLLLRGMYWAKRASLYTLIFGWVLFGHKYVGQGLLFAEGRQLSNRSWWILMGGFLGTVMWFNVWFILYPRMRQLMLGMVQGKMPADAAAMTATANAASKFNLFASGPLLFAMIVPNNFAGWPAPAIILCTLVGVGFWYGLLKRAFKINP